MKKTLLLLAGISAFGFTRAADVTITDDDLTTGTYNWTKDNVYILDGLVYLESGTLNIAAGTVIKALANPSNGTDNTSALFITRGAKIMATGTASEPIIFTAELDDLTPNSGLTKYDVGQWGGLVLLGNAPAEKKGVTNAIQIEGIPTTETRGQYGGNDPMDNSGVLKYVSIRYSGVGFQPGDELQGLTLGGVGAGTEIDYCEVYVSGDDGVECFGGTVDLKHFVVAYAEDDALDFDLGYRGRLQHVFVIQRSEAEGYDHIGEWDGASPDDATLYSAPTIYNLTAVGPGTTATGRARAILMRENFAGQLYNSIFTDFPGKGIQVQDLDAGQEDSYNKLIAGEIKLRSITWANMGVVTAIGIGANGLIDVTSKDGKDNPVTPDHGDCTELLAELNDNNNEVIATSAIMSVSRDEDGNLNPHPVSIDNNVNTPPNDGFFDQVDYRGAFDGSNNWMKGWTALASLGYMTSAEDVQATVNNLSVYPNPTTTQVTVSYDNVNAGKVSVTIVNTLGQTVKSVAAEDQTVGNQKVTVNTANLTAGVYFVNITNNGSTATKKLIVK